MNAQSTQNQTDVAELSAASAAGKEADAGSLAAWLVLGLIIDQPSHGYELSLRFERFEAVLSLSRSSLYAVLERLLKTRMIEEIDLEPVGQVSRKHKSRRSYRATAEGASSYRRWVVERIGEDPQWTQVMGQVACASLLGLDALVHVVDRFEGDSLREMKSLPTSDLEQTPLDVDSLVETLILDKRRREMRARIDWATHARHVIDRYAKRTAEEQDRGPS
jgi:DNA-binding PadR family transcriptional regulator